jgi:hypothetical protein
MPMIPLTWMAITSCLWLIADNNPGFKRELTSVAEDKWASAIGKQERFVVRHPLANLDRMSYWRQCWDRGLSDHEKYVLWDHLKQIRDFEASIDWEQLEQVVDFLKTKGVGDREVIAWHDSPHAAYLMLGIKPGIRFMHITTAQLINCEQLKTELNATKDTARFLICDLEVYAHLYAYGRDHDRLVGPPGCDLLPSGMTNDDRDCNFPFDQKPVLFRSRVGEGKYGRYTVHTLVPPYGPNVCPSKP